MGERMSLQWLRAKECTGGNCVEVAQVDGGVHIRDSKNPNQPPLEYTAAEWHAFVAGVKAGDFTF